MSLWIKICANTSVEDALLSADAGADAVGFVFAPSPRRVTPTQVAEIVPHLPKAVEKIGVFVDTPFAEIEAAVRACGLTGVQLHSDAGPELPAQFRNAFGSALRILRVIHFGPQAVQQATATARDANVDGVLVDSRTAISVGGTGLRFDWVAAESLFRKSELHRHRLIVAGGLTPANVAEAIDTLHPWGVDVVSGVEAAPGRKDPGKVRAFIENARGPQRP